VFEYSIRDLAGFKFSLSNTIQVLSCINCSMKIEGITPKSSVLLYLLYTKLRGYYEAEKE